VNVVKRITHGIGRLFRSVGHEIANTIRFGAVPVSVDATGPNLNANAAGVAAGVSGLRNDERPAEREVEGTDRD
jgi:hypothetical protein